MNSTDTADDAAGATLAALEADLAHAELLVSDAMACVARYPTGALRTLVHSRQCRLGRLRAKLEWARRGYAVDGTGTRAG